MELLLCESVLPLVLRFTMGIDGSGIGRMHHCMAAHLHLIRPRTLPPPAVESDAWNAMVNAQLARSWCYNVANVVVDL
jgi:hypothetical protein